VRLQPILRKVINADQMAILTLRGILDNVLLTHETLAWAKQKYMPWSFIKVYFTKAYNTMNWKFVFSTMVVMGFYVNFRAMTTRLFQAAKAIVNIEGQPSKSFDIQRGVMQGCPLASYLLLIVGEVLDHMVKRAMATKEFKRNHFTRKSPQSYYNPLCI
jgi:hypothetical protein